MKKFNFSALILWIIGLIAAIIILLLIFWLGVVPHINNRIAIGIRDEIKNVPLPTKTEYVDSVWGVDKFHGNGDGVQYFGAILIKSDLELEEIDAHYAQYGSDEGKYIVEKQTGKEIVAVRDVLSFETDVAEDDFYIVYLLQYEVPYQILNSDLRGA